MVLGIKEGVGDQSNGFFVLSLLHLGMARHQEGVNIDVVEVGDALTGWEIAVAQKVETIVIILCERAGDHFCRERVIPFNGCLVVALQHGVALRDGSMAGFQHLVVLFEVKSLFGSEFHGFRIAFGGLCEVLFV